MTALEHGEKRKCTTLELESSYVRRGLYKRRLWNINSNVNPNNSVLNGSLCSRTEGLQTAKQFNWNKVFEGTESLEKHVEDASDPELHVSSYDLLHNSLSTSAIVITGDIVADDNVTASNKVHVSRRVILCDTPRHFQN